MKNIIVEYKAAIFGVMTWKVLEASRLILYGNFQLVIK